MNFEGKIVLVIGVSCGIGCVIVEMFVVCGVKVIGIVISENGVQVISDYLGVNGKGLMLNVIDLVFIEFVLEKICVEFGEVDILVNNVGIICDNLLM